MIAGYIRPTIRGDLVHELAQGKPCEVAAHAAEMTDIMLRGWLEFDAFTVRESENRGWVVFEPTTGDG